MEIELGFQSLEEVLGAVVWLTAIWLYVDYRGHGEGGFKRFAAFWLGFPVTLGLKCVIPGGTRSRKQKGALAGRGRAAPPGRDPERANRATPLTP